MESSLIDWMTNESPFMEYAVKTQLLGEPMDAKSALDDARIGRIIQRIQSKESGLPALQRGLMPYTKFGNAFWDLFFLSDIGLLTSDIGIENEVEAFFSLQDENGYFVVQNNTKPHHVCIPAILLRSLAMMGYKNDARVVQFVRNVAALIRPDGGFHCALNRARGKKLADTDSCPMDTQNILMLLGLYEPYRTDPAYNGAIDFLLRHWARRMEPWRPYGFGAGTDYHKLRYPAAKYGILRVADALSLFPYATAHDTFNELMDCIEHKAVDGQYYAESASKSYADFDFGQKKTPSTWITFIISRIRKRMDETA